MVRARSAAGGRVNVRDPAGIHLLLTRMPLAPARLRACWPRREVLSAGAGGGGGSPDADHAVVARRMAVVAL